MRLSGLQREVLKLYRQCIRKARKKPEVSQEPHIEVPRSTSNPIRRVHVATFAQSLGQYATSFGRPIADVYSREFRKSQSLDKKDFSAIETLLRMGHRKLELYSSPGVTDIH